MKAKVAILFSLLFSVSFCQAQLLWKVTSNDTPKPSYILGTCHAVSIDFCDSLKGFQTAFDSTQQFIGEISFFDPIPDDVQRRMVTLYETMPEGHFLSELYSEEDYNLIIAYVNSVTGTDANAINFTPSGLQNYLYNQLLTKAFPDLSLNAMDIALQFRAKGAEKEVLGLETMQFQFDLLYPVKKLNEQAADLLEFVKDPENEPNASLQSSKELLSIYLGQDINKIETYFSKSMTSDMEGKFVCVRNIRWMPKLMDAFNEKPVFVAVGAAHLVGEYGLLELLRKCGYTVEAVE